MWKEFKDFIMTGNVIDFTVAVILAGAIGLVVNGFVSDIAMPIIGNLKGDVDLSQMKYVLSAAVIEDGNVVKPENAIRYGAWINSIVNLVFVGGILFFLVKTKNKIDPPAPKAAAGPSEVDLLKEIRDSLKK